MIRLGMLALTVLATLMGPLEAEAGRRRWRRCPPRCVPIVPCAPACVPLASYSCCVPCASTPVSCLNSYIFSEEPTSSGTFHWYLTDEYLHHCANELCWCEYQYPYVHRDPSPDLYCPEDCPNCFTITNAKKRAQVEGKPLPPDLDDVELPLNKEKLGRNADGSPRAIMPSTFKFKTLNGGDQFVYAQGFHWKVPPQKCGDKGLERRFGVGLQSDKSDDDVVDCGTAEFLRKKLNSDGTEVISKKWVRVTHPSGPVFFVRLK